MAYVIQQLQALNDLTVGISVNVGVVKGGLGSNVIAQKLRPLSMCGAVVGCCGAH